MMYLPFQKRMLLMQDLKKNPIHLLKRIKII